MPRTPGVYATFDTSEGTIVCRLFEAEAPITVKNFIELAEGSREWTHPHTRAKSKTPLYNGTIFHRVIPDFMVQGGDPAGTGMGGPGYQFQDETKGSPHKFDKPGKLAMANSGPKPMARSSSSPWRQRRGSPAITPSLEKWSKARTSPTRSPSSRAIARTSRTMMWC